MPKETRAMNQRTGRRRLIAALRIPQADERLLEAVQPYLPDADSAGELAYRLWRRGLELTLAELASLGVALPTGMTEEQLATLSAQRMLLLLPLLRRTSKLALLNLEHATSLHTPQPLAPTAVGIDEAAAGVVADLGGTEFL
jgi:hypothetical protein